MTDLPTSSPDTCSSEFAILLGSKLSLKLPVKFIAFYNLGELDPTLMAYMIENIPLSGTNHFRVFSNLHKGFCVYLFLII